MRIPSAGSRWLLVLAAAAATLCAMHLAPRKANADRGGQLRGVMLSPNWEWPAPHGETAADLDREVAAACGVGATLARFIVKWSHLEPSRGRISPGYAARVERVLNTARSCGLRVIVTLMQTPCWASTDRRHCGSWSEIEAPRKPSRYGRVTRKVLRRWGDRIAALEVWNEPNQAQFWRGSVREYVAMVRAAGRAAAKLDSPVKILAGALAGPDRGYLRRMYRRGLRRHDGISIHPYNVKLAGTATGFADPTLAGADAGAGSRAFRLGVPMIRRTMRRHDDKKKGIWLTEFGFAACPAMGHCVPEATQAEWIAKSFQLAAGWRYVDGLILFSLRDIGLGGIWHNRFGLLRRDFTPRPSYAAVRATLATLP